MNIRLQILEKLYDGDAEQADRMHTEHPELTGELEAMRSMKTALDARPRRRADRSAVDAVVRAAADASAGRSLEDTRPRARQDRKPRARRAVYLRSAGVATAVVTILIAVTTVWQANLLPEIPPLTDGTVLEAESAVGGASANGEASPDEATGAAETADAAGGAARMERRAGAEDPAATADRRAAAVDLAASKSLAAPQAFEAAQDLAASEDLAAVDDVAASRSLVVAEELEETQEREAAQNRASFVSSRAAGLAGQDGTAGGNRSPQPAANRRPSSSSEFDVLTNYRSAELIPAGIGSMDEAALGRATYQDDLAWDQMADVVEVYRQIEVIEEGVALGWEPPSVPLEMMPTPSRSRDTGIQPAGERRRP